jgi:peptide/nickel transport system ATP-binding protein
MLYNAQNSAALSVGAWWDLLAPCFALALLGLVDIPTDRLNAYPHQLSGGMRQRIVIAICLSLDPKLLIMDEPTTALDVVVQREILQRIDVLRRQLGFSVLFITHDLGLMVQVSDRIGIMLEGELVEVNDARTIYRAPQHAYTRKLWASMPRLHGAQITGEVTP